MLVSFVDVCFDGSYGEMNSFSVYSAILISLQACVQVLMWTKVFISLAYNCGGKSAGSYGGLRIRKERHGVFPSGSVVKNPPAKAGGMGSIPDASE